MRRHDTFIAHLPGGSRYSSSVRVCRYGKPLTSFLLNKAQFLLNGVVVASTERTDRKHDTLDLEVVSSPQTHNKVVLVLLSTTSENLVYDMRYMLSLSKV